jgi:tetratricopeptide (TPR) repeat protein
VDKLSRKSRILFNALAVCAGILWFMPVLCAAQDVYGSPPPQKSSVTGSIKSGFNKVGELFVPKSNSHKMATDDPISLNNKGKPSAELYTAIAKLYEESGRYAEAEQYYQMALKEKPDDLAALLGFARFQENQKRVNEAITLYQRAAKIYPKDAVAYNNLGLCFARHGKLNEAAPALEQAVKLDPQNPLYRNNFATVLVDQNRLSEAFAVLREVHGDASAYYNMGYLLNKKGKTDLAEQHFSQALRVNPKMAAAQKWLHYLNDKSREETAINATGDGSVRIGSVPGKSNFPAKVITPPAANFTNSMPYAIPNSPETQRPILPQRLPPPGYLTGALSQAENRAAVSTQSESPPLPPAINLPQRLPPVSLRQPKGSLDPSNAPPNSEGPSMIAPLPPVTQ